MNTSLLEKVSQYFLGVADMPKIERLSLASVTLYLVVIHVDVVNDD